jgi:DNA-binding NtrC family response regulator
MSEHLQGRILAVDDEESWRGILGRQLASAEVDHIIAENADEAVRLMEPDAFTGVITDGLEGEWTKVYSSANITDTGIVVLSGSADVLEHAQRMGIDAYNKNNIELSMFADIIRSLVLPQ